MTIFVFEGIDNTGKTSICEKLAKDYSYPHFSFPTENFKKTWFSSGKIKDVNDVVRESLLISNRAEYYSQIKDASRSNHVIIDRFVHSGIAYAKAVSDWDKNPDLAQAAVDSVLWELAHPPFKFHVIYFRVDKNTLVTRVRDEQDIYDTDDELQFTVASTFDIMAKDNPDSWSIIDIYDEEGNWRLYDNIYNEVVSIIEKN